VPSGPCDAAYAPRLLEAQRRLPSSISAQVGAPSLVELSAVERRELARAKRAVRKAGGAVAEDVDGSSDDDDGVAPVVAAGRSKAAARHSVGGISYAPAAATAAPTWAELVCRRGMLRDIGAVADLQRVLPGLEVWCVAAFVLCCVAAALAHLALPHPLTNPNNHAARPSARWRQLP